jgi:hypothetical protein
MFQQRPLRPRGSHLIFFKLVGNFWRRSEIDSLHMLKREDSMSDINYMFLVLIPKVASPEELGECRPISLCNVIYKIVSKVMVNRLKICLLEIIAEK